MIWEENSNHATSLLSLVDMNVHTHVWNLNFVICKSILQEKLILLELVILYCVLDKEQ